jgi:hypothetical protein
MTENNTQTLRNKLNTIIRAHQTTYFALRHVAVYGPRAIYGIVVATILALFAAGATYLALIVGIIAAHDSIVGGPPETVDLDSPAAANSAYLVGSIVWIIVVLYRTHKMGQTNWQIDRRTPYGTMEYNNFGNPHSRSRELVAQAVVARALGLGISAVRLPLNDFGWLSYSLTASHYFLDLRSRAVGSAALSIAGGSLRQDHAALDDFIARDAISAEPSGFTRDEVIREASVFTAEALDRVDDMVLKAIERELRLIGRIDAERFEELVTGHPGVASSVETAPATAERETQRTSPASW